MNREYELLWSRIAESIFDGILVIGFNGIIQHSNEAAIKLLGIPEESLIGNKFASLFFDDERNDQFAQTILDSIYDMNNAHVAVVPYFDGEKTTHLRVISSFLTEGEKKLGVIILISDLSELIELREAVKSMETIKALNDKLAMRNKLISDTFGRFLSDDIVKQLLDTPDGLRLGGKKQRLTIMMSDLRGFTAMSERMDPMDLITMLNHYLGIMTDIIQKHKGTIIEFLGDGIFAIFGAPEATTTHAGDGVAAAIEMEAAMEEVNKWNVAHDYPMLEMGIGINTGEVILGNIGSEKRTKYGVVGSHVNLCGRIESYTVGGQVLISPMTKELIDSDLEIAKTMVVYPKGANGELELSHVTGIGEPYNVHVTVVDSAMQHFEHPIPVCFYKIDGKHASAEAFYGGILAVARDGAIIETTADLQVFDNIQVIAGGKLFCKIIEKTDNGFKLQYTSIPTGYGVWLKNHQE